MAANLAKYRQLGYAKQALFDTGSRAIGEATTNPIFGIGLTLNSKTVTDTGSWNGKNLMGQILGEVRGKLS